MVETTTIIILELFKLIWLYMKDFAISSREDFDYHSL